MAQSRITCRELVDFLMAFVNDELPADERAAFEAHLAVCRACVTYLTGYRDAVRLGRQAFAYDDGIPADVPDELVTAVMRTLRRESSSSD
jgi:anti-sigma factor RsiW